MRAVSICWLVGVVLMAVPAGVSAQSQPSDPEADSPSGVVYELPVDRARKDAAPRRGSSRQAGDGDSGAGGSRSTGRSPGDSGAGGESDTSIRSENNFGTSSRVPGADSAKSSRRGEDGAGGVTGGSEGSGRGPVDSFAELAPRSTTASGEGPSDSVVFLLLGALLAVGAVIGVVAGRRAARDRRG